MSYLFAILYQPFAVVSFHTAPPLAHHTSIPPLERLPSGTAATPAHKATKAPESLTKKQRQNKQRHEDAKAARDAGEAERLAALDRHKRQLENEKINAQFTAGEGKGRKGKESGGMVASVDEKGRLVWE